MMFIGGRHIKCILRPFKPFQISINKLSGSQQASRFFNRCRPDSMTGKTASSIQSFQVDEAVRHVRMLESRIYMAVLSTGVIVTVKQFCSSHSLCLFAASASNGYPGLIFLFPHETPLHIKSKNFLKENHVVDRQNSSAQKYTYIPSLNT